jgi:hypothetical protein
MKTLVSAFTLALAIAFTGPAFAGDVGEEAVAANWLL